jgi:transcriptional regulator with XRE-family HTH domain
MQKISERLRIIRLKQKKTQLEMANYVGIPQRTWSNYEGGKTEIPVHIILKLEDLGYSIGWIAKGGESPDADEPDSHTPVAGETAIANRGVIINKPSPHSVAQVGINNRVTMYPPNETMAIAPVVEAKEVDQMVQAMTVFEIPLLTKEQVLHFDPAREIPDPKAHSGSYPDYTLVPMPRRFQDYSTDLRAMVVFNGLMTPLLAPGDVAVFQATGWLGDGVYVYRVNGDLHIGHVWLIRGQYLITNEVKPEAELAYDTETFRAIGRVRAVVREIG